MAVYSTQFLIATFESNPTYVWYTVPAGALIVVRSISAHDPHGNCQVTLGTLANPSLIGVAFVPGGTEYFANWNGYQVFNAMDELVVNANDDDTTVLASGYLLYTP